MNLINIEKITKSYTDRKLFDNASFSLQEGEKVGIIGINGTGKTTLLKMIAGLEEPEEGCITRANHIVVRYLPQHPEFQEDKSSLQCVLEGNITEENQWSIESEAKAMMTRLGIIDFEQPAGQLSGGQRKRLALISVLLSPADVLLLDEPTNHLDNDMADWLEEYLKKWRGALIMITHDRYFLDSVTNRIVEIDKGATYSYQTNYSGFLELKTQREEMELASERKRQSILRVELEWIRRGARARSTNQKAHIQRYETLRDMEGPKEVEKLQMGSVSSRLGNKTIELESISKAFGEKCIIKDFNYIFLSDDRIGIVGENGCGKSTLMKIITGAINPDTGSVEIGQTVKIGYFSQENEYLPEDMKVIDYIRDIAEFVQTEEGPVSAVKMLERFLFNSTLQYQMIGRLSGGEKRRLYLLKILMEAPNVLILDEPTNDLDIATMMILEDYLDTFKGIVISVSHDRYFLNRVVNRIFAYENGSIVQYEGNYDDYIAKRPEVDSVTTGKSQETKRNEKTNVKPRTEKLKMSYNEMREFETIDDDIAKLEEKIESLEKEILANSTDFVKLNKLTAEKEETEEMLSKKMEKWMYLNELNDRINGGK